MLYEREGLLGSTDERQLLTTFLDDFRRAIVRKVEGVSDEDAARPGVASGTSLLWIVQHLADVERWWFGNVFMAEPDEAPSPGFAEPLAEAVARYEAECARSREITAAASELTDLARHPKIQPTMRWILVHMIEEPARHAGHADILREQLDGTIGE
jgi:uncharacterized damage-inducible protein DinB